MRRLEVVVVGKGGVVRAWPLCYHAGVGPLAQECVDADAAGVSETGEIAHWAAEVLPTPSMMRNMKVGWTRTTLKPGDQIVLVCNPPRATGAKACLAKELKVNGKDWPVAPGGGGAPGAAKGKQ